MVEKYSNGVDLNCGCPQKWAIKVFKSLIKIRILFVFMN